ncbi:MAG: B12-binding domain-containing radical SAM protein [Sedimentisphaerales bacterium]|nr:B12-binding domain-containing radical SAM protein [Sedimentisphaerales bacterium]
MRIALINPVARRTRGYHNCGSITPQLGLQVLARLTPDEHNVDIIDEACGGDQTLNLLQNGRYDLVGITAYTSGATRAYELSAWCRQHSLTCIMGGPHAWARPDEAQEHFDSIALGECDEIWPAILADAAGGKLQRRYQGSHVDLQQGFGRADQTRQPINGMYEIGCIQTSRGCPVGCDYCSVTRFNGAEIRRRPIDDIIEEWNTTPDKFLFVVDDNFFGVGEKHAIWAKEMLTAIRQRGKKRLWFSQTTINMGDDPEGLKLAYKAGCRGMLIGFESFNFENLLECHKGINRKYADHYRRMVKAFHRAGIAVFGAFIVGLDGDDENTVSHTIEQAVKLGIDIIQITNMTPLPGTRQFDRYMAENRIFADNFPADWERFTFVETVYHPRNITARQLDESIYELRQAAATINWPWKRSLRTFLHTRSLSTTLFVHNVNTQFARLARAISPQDEANFGFVPTLNSRTQRIHRAMRLRDNL